MRLSFYGSLGVGLLAAQVAIAQCVRPVDTTAFDITGLKTQLMVTALTCRAQDRYNAFVIKFRPDLAAQDRNASSYFARVYGRNARTRQDDYVTQLANSKSQLGLQQGSLFCDRNVGVFDEVMALKSAGELQEYAAGRTAGSPTTLTACTDNAAEPGPSRTRTAHRRG